MPTTMRVEVDCNIDRITISNTVLPCRNPNQVVAILETVFNLMPHSEFHNIQLIRIDEDTSTTIGEW